MKGDKISLRCDNCGRVSDMLFNCYCREVVCPDCRAARHGAQGHRYKSSALGELDMKGRINGGSYTASRKQETWGGRLKKRCPTTKGF